MMRALARSAAFAVLIAAAPAAADDLSEPDLFFGTLTKERGEVILTRCDLAATRYLLRDAAGSQAVERYRPDGNPSYAEVIATYAEEEGRHVLLVREFAKRVPGGSCHLSDALERFGRALPEQ